MARSNYFSFVNFLLFCTLLQKNYLISLADKCADPSFGPNQGVVIDYFFDSDVDGISNYFCPVVQEFKGLLKVIFRMSNNMEYEENCVESDSCIYNRYFACYYKHYQSVYDNVCAEPLPKINPVITNCVCGDSADNILISNEALRNKYGVKTLPALVVDGKYDPCFTDYSTAGIKEYFCKAYKYAPPVCS